MSLHHSPRIVTDGLVLCIDAANLKSYPGPSNVWVNLVDTSVTGNLVSDPIHDGSSFSFDGNLDRVIFTSNTIAQVGSGNHTITAIVKNNITTEEDIFGTTWGATGDVLLMIYSAAGGGSGGLRGHASDVGGGPNTIDSPNAIGTGNWNMLSQRVTWGANIELLEGTTIANSQVLTNSAATSTRTQAFVGKRNNVDGTGGFNGNIAIVLVYDRALTSDEMEQNYNAFRGRFGL